MTRRIFWMLIDPCDKEIYDRLVTGITSDQFTSKVSSGFLMDVSRGDFIRARFVERNEIVERLTDPFGNQTEVKRTEYRQVAFCIQNQAPQLEIYDAPRQINAFMNRLGEFTRGTTAIYAPDVTVSAWLRVLAEQASSLVVTGALVADLELGENVLAKVALTGERDVRKYISGFAGTRKYLLSQALAKVRFNKLEAVIRIRPEGRLTISSSNEEIESGVRKCLKTILQNKRGRRS